MIKKFSSEQLAKTSDLKADLIMRQYKLDKMAKFREIKSINPKLKQSELAKELALTTFTLQRYRRKLNMLSPYRTIQSSNTHTRRQKVSNHTEHNLKVPSKDLKITLNVLKMTSNEPVKKNKLKGGDPSKEKATQRCILIEQVFLSHQLTEFTEIKKKMPIYKTKFHKPLKNTTKNHCQQDLKKVEKFQFKV